MKYLEAGNLPLPEPSEASSAPIEPIVVAPDFPERQGDEFGLGLQLSHMNSFDAGSGLDPSFDFVRKPSIMGDDFPLSISTPPDSSTGVSNSLESLAGSGLRRLASLGLEGKWQVVQVRCSCISHNCLRTRCRND